ncbi:MAG: hypothetical protein ABIF12_03935 [bacterium]
MKIVRYKNKNSKFFIKPRLEKIEKNFNLTLGRKSKLIISVCSSGGGFRSMLATLGALRGLHDLKLLNSIHYISTISGSSWAVLPWILSDKNIIQFNENLVSQLDKFYCLKNFSKLDFEKLKSYKIFFLKFYEVFISQKKFKQNKGQNLNFIDLYGMFVSMIIFQDLGLNFQDLTLHQLSKKLERGMFPYPIFSATSELNNHKYEWFEFTPHYIGSKEINFFLNSEYFDKNLITLLGILGSSFSGSFKDVLNRMMQLPLPLDFVDFLNKTKNKLESGVWGNKRIGAAYLDNFAYGLNSRIKNVKKIPVFDGGYISNLPLEPLFNQEVASDIIFVIDNAGILPQTSVLKDTVTQLLKKGIKLPEIDYEIAKKQSLSIFKGKLGVPTIIYIPLKKDLTYSKIFDPQLDKFCGTTNFFYSKKQAELLMGLTQHVIHNNKDKILKLL